MKSEDVNEPTEELPSARDARLETTAHDAPVAQNETLEKSSPAVSVELLGTEIQKLREHVDLEFIRREARLIPSLMNFWQHFRLSGARTDLRSKAALSSVLWRFFSPGTAAAATGGLLLILQTVLLARQNEKLDQQTELMQAQANVGVSTLIGPLLSEISTYLEKSCLKENLDPTELIAGTEVTLPNCWHSVPVEIRRNWVKACLSRTSCTARSALAMENDAEGATMPLPARLATLVTALNQSLRPYRFLDPTDLPQADNSKLVSRPLSPERGVLLTSMIALGVSIHRFSADFRNSFAPSAELSNADVLILHGGWFPNARMSNAAARGSWNEVSFPCAHFSGTDFRKLKISGGDYSSADFSLARLPDYPPHFKPGRLDGADFSAARVGNIDYVQELAKLNIPGFDPNAWEVKATDNPSEYWLDWKSPSPRVARQCWK